MFSELMIQRIFYQSKSKITENINFQPTHKVSMFHQVMITIIKYKFKLIKRKFKVNVVIVSI